MIESALQLALASDGALAALVSTYQGNPAIFSEDAPEDAVLPYIVYSVSRLAADHPAAEQFNVYVDYYDNGKSRANSRKAAQRIEFCLDQKTLANDRYDSIRVFYESAGPVPDPDPRVIHYNLQFTARAGRKAWAQQLTEES
jgi:hypothetical protein